MGPSYLVSEDCLWGEVLQALEAGEEAGVLLVGVRGGSELVEDEMEAAEGLVAGIGHRTRMID